MLATVSRNISAVLPNLSTVSATQYAPLPTLCPRVGFPSPPTSPYLCTHLILTCTPIYTCLLSVNGGDRCRLYRDYKSKQQISRTLIQFRSSNTGIHTRSALPPAPTRLTFIRNHTRTSSPSLVTANMASGGSIVAIKYNGGVLMAADTLLSYGSLAKWPNIPRIKLLGGHS
ncbi:Proteasome subunit, putative, partial [Leishmania lindenbergi]